MNKEGKTRLLYFLAALGALVFTLLATRDGGFLRLVYSGLAVVCTIKAFAFKHDLTDQSPRADGSEDETSVAEAVRAPPSTGDRVARGLGRLVLWIVLAPFALLVVFTAGWASLCMIRGSCG